MRCDKYTKPQRPAVVQVGPAPAEGQKSVGYMIHESGRWSDVHQKWFFLPRKLSRESYDEVGSPECSQVDGFVPYTQYVNLRKVHQPD